MSRKAAIDDYNHGGKKTTVAKETHKMLNVNQDNAILGIKTGLKLYTEKPFDPENPEKREQRPRQERPREERPREERPEKKERKVSGAERKNSGEARRKTSGEAKKGGKSYQKESYVKPDERKAGVKPRSSKPQQQERQQAAPKSKFVDNDQSFPTLGWKTLISYDEYFVKLLHISFNIIWSFFVFYSEIFEFVFEFVC